MLIVCDLHYFVQFQHIIYTPLTDSFLLGLFTCIHTSATLLILQDQYVFIHDALCDYITCGDTSVPAHELKAAIATFMRVNKNTKMTGFQEQFDVRGIKYNICMFWPWE